MLLGVDPGTRKCGFAVIERAGAPTAHARDRAAR